MPSAVSVGCNPGQFFFMVSRLCSAPDFKEPIAWIPYKTWACTGQPHLRVSHEFLQAVHKVCAVEGVSSNAHHSALPQAFLGRLEHSLIGEGARPGHNADFARCVDVTLHTTSTA